MLANPSLLTRYITHGVYVISVAHGAEQNAFTAAWVMQVSFDPPLLAFSINPQHYSYSLLKMSGKCTINVLGQNHLAIAAHFGTAGVKNKMTTYPWQQGESNAPVLSDSLAYFACELSHITDAGDHKIAVCRVVSGADLNSGWPLLYSQTRNMDGSRELYNSQK